ncbi:type II toxin-antitoxin system VapC family toxin [soil metagenome]
MIAVDTSVAVAAFGDWHRLHPEAIAVLDDGAGIPAHALLETYSVLSGFPPPHRAAPGLVSEWLDARFIDVLAPPDPEAQRGLVRLLADAGRTGGAVYDGVIGLTARIAGATLVTADQRAATIYELCGVEVRLLGPQRG